MGAGAVGLIQAYDRFNPAMGVAFSTFASHRIRGAMLDELRRQDWLTKPARRRLKEIQRAFAKVEQREGRPASEEEAARELGVPVERLRDEMVEVGPATLVFLDGLKAGEGGGWQGFIADGSAQAPDRAAEASDLKAALALAVGRLPERERQVLTLLVHEELGQAEIAQVLGISPGRVSQIHTSAILRLRAWLGPKFEAAS